MKLPAVAIAALFALGIAFGLSPYAAHQASSHRFIIFLFGVITAALFAGLFLAFLKKFVLATVASITCWTLLGFTGAVFDQQPTRLDHILQLADADKVEEFLIAVHPRIVVISAGESNAYGHPSPELLERLEAVDVRILRSDRDGAVRIITNGENLEISCFVACPEPQAIAASTSAQIPNQSKNDQQQ
jgi:hypothetical protein